MSYTDSETANETEDADSDEEIVESLPVHVDFGAKKDHPHHGVSDNHIITIEKEDDEQLSSPPPPANVPVHCGAPPVVLPARIQEE